MKYLFVCLCIGFISLSACAESWVFSAPNQVKVTSPNSNFTIQYYPPEIGSNTIRAPREHTGGVYVAPPKIEPNVQPNPLKDELEKTVVSMK